MERIGTNMVKQSIEQKIKVIISDQVGVAVDSITPQTTWEDMEADSLDKIEVMMLIEEEFEIAIDDDEGDKINNFQELLHYVTNIVQGQD